MSAPDADGFVGRGWQDPFTVSDGRVATSGGTVHIDQSIRIILGTAPGERVMRPDFGCRIHDLVFAANDPATAAAASSAVHDALAVWEPRIDVLSVTARDDTAQPTLLLIDIAYEVRATNSRVNLVHPFYLE
jgi:phage baseplate assembly protein W